MSTLTRVIQCVALACAAVGAPIHGAKGASADVSMVVRVVAPESIREYANRPSSLLVTAVPYWYFDVDPTTSLLARFLYSRSDSIAWMDFRSACIRGPGPTVYYALVHRGRF